MTALQQWGSGIIHALQQFSPALDGPMAFLSFLGREDFFVLLVGFLYWCVDPGWGLRALGALLASDFANHLFKWAFHAPRPYWVDPQVRALSTETSYGIPSGHAQTGVAFWGYHANTLRRAWAWAAAAVIVLGISISRVYLGVHFPHDVVAGWVSGALVLAVYLWLQPRAAAWLRSRSPGLQVAAAAGISVAMVLVALAVRAAIGGIADPPAWEAQAAAAYAPVPGGRATGTRDLNGLMVLVGMAFGAGTGAALARRSVPFDARGPWASRILRFALGIIVLLALRVGLGAVFPREPETVALFFRAVRYAAMGLWAVWLAPWVFVRLRLAQGPPARQ